MHTHAHTHTHTQKYTYLPNHSAQAGYDTRSISKESLTFEFRVFLLLN